MVVDNPGRTGEASGTSVRCLSHLPSHRLSAKAAADSALRIAELVAAGRAAGRAVGHDGPDEEAIFAALHTCAYRATNPTPRDPAPSAEQDKWSIRWKLIRDYIVEHNLGLAYSATSRFYCTDVRWDDLMSEANFALVRAVERFNPWYGFRFSTYACNAITRALISIAGRESKYRLRFPIEHDVAFECPGQTDVHSELLIDRLNRALNDNVAELTDREAMVLGWRFPRGGAEKLTLSEIGELIGMSKEGVRLIQGKALAKLRQALEIDPVLQ